MANRWPPRRRRRDHPCCLESRLALSGFWIRCGGAQPLTVAVTARSGSQNRRADGAMIQLRAAPGNNEDFRTQRATPFEALPVGVESDPSGGGRMKNRLQESCTGSARCGAKGRCLPARATPSTRAPARARGFAAPTGETTTMAPAMFFEERPLSASERSFTGATRVECRFFA